MHTYIQYVHSCVYVYSTFINCHTHIRLTIAVHMKCPYVSNNTNTDTGNINFQKKSAFKIYYIVGLIANTAKNIMLKNTLWYI